MNHNNHQLPPTPHQQPLKTNAWICRTLCSALVIGLLAASNFEPISLTPHPKYSWEPTCGETLTTKVEEMEAYGDVTIRYSTKSKRRVYGPDVWWEARFERPNTNGMSVSVEISDTQQTMCQAIDRLYVMVTNTYGLPK
jgi:hypothetical protein